MAISVIYHNRFICDGIADGDPIVVARGVSAHDGTHWVHEQQQPGRPEYKPRILDRDEIGRLALIRVSNAELAAAAGAKLEEKYFRETWQRRQIRKENRRDCDMWATAHGWIGHDRNHVIHPQLIQDRQFQKSNWRKFAEGRVLRSQDGQEIRLAEVMEQSAQNKRAELYTLVKGIQKVAEANGLTWGMLTLSCPPQFHPRPSNGHNSWDGSTPADAHKWLHDSWRGVLRRLSKKGISISGIRFGEFHQDGCPHWHVLFFSNHLEELVREVRKVWTTSAGADFKIGDPSKGSFATYCMSYLAGNSDAPHIQQYDAKRAVWSQRFYQFFGIPQLSLWRSARAMTEAPGDGALADAIWRAARRGDGAAFIQLNGGLAVTSKDRPASGKIDRTPVPNQTKTAVIKTADGTFRQPLPYWQIQRGVAVIANYPREPKTDSANPHDDPHDDPPPIVRLVGRASKSQKHDARRLPGGRVKNQPYPLSISVVVTKASSTSPSGFLMNRGTARATPCAVAAPLH